MSKISLKILVWSSFFSQIKTNLGGHTEGDHAGSPLRIWAATQGGFLGILGRFANRPYIFIVGMPVGGVFGDVLAELV